MVKYISDHIGVMHLGHLVETGTTDEIFKNPIHPYTKSLLSAIPKPNPVVEKHVLLSPMTTQPVELIIAKENKSMLKVNIMF